MLETGEPENDGFAQMIRGHRQDRAELSWIVKICKK
jgi:hypothetical protein